jgi:hypothetical protein
MKTTIHKILLFQILILFARMGNSQGFVNLDFESANLIGYSPGNLVPASNAFPSWAVSAQFIPYDDFSLSGDSISIMDTNSPFFTTSIQGKYYALFEAANTPGSTHTISLAQTGTIPVGTQSITFWGNIGNLQVTFNGQPLAFSQIGSTASYNIYGANIPQFAGDTGQLLFSLPPAPFGSASLDNIQFSSSAIPEPGEFALLIMGALSFEMWRRRKSPR